MPDISMCADEICPSRETCYRSPASGTKPTEYRQAWMEFRRDPDSERCPDYWQRNHQA